MKSLGLADNQHELDAIRKQREKLDEREEELKNQLLARVKGVHPNEVGSTYGCDTEVNKAIRSRVEAHEELRTRGQEERVPGLTGDGLDGALPLTLLDARYEQIPLRHVSTIAHGPRCGVTGVT